MILVMRDQYSFFEVARQCFLSTYNRSPGECGEIVGNLTQLLSRQTYSEPANVDRGSAEGCILRAG
jgi:hypothetical protein